MINFVITTDKYNVTELVRLNRKEKYGPFFNYKHVNCSKHSLSFARYLLKVVYKNKHSYSEIGDNLKIEIINE